MNMNDEQWLALRQRLKEEDYLWIRILKLIGEHGTPEMVKQALLTAGVAAAEIEEVMRLQPKANAFLSRYPTPEAIAAVKNAVRIIYGDEALACLRKIKPIVTKPPEGPK